MFFFKLKKLLHNLFFRIIDIPDKYHFFNRISLEIQNVLIHKSLRIIKCSVIKVHRLIVLVICKKCPGYNDYILLASFTAHNTSDR